jgi:hypothetical protein
MRILLLLLAFLLAACPGSPPAQTRPPDPVQTPPNTTDPGSPQDVKPTQPSTPPPGPETPVQSGGEKKADGADCFDGSECSSGTCEGEGCTADKPGKCMPRARGCTRDLRTYCGCDGKTFRASGSCPLQRFSAREKCPGS